MAALWPTKPFMDYVCVCVHKAAVPEGSRQSKGVNSSLMVGIQQSPVVSLPTRLEPMTERLF